MPPAIWKSITTFYTYSNQLKEPSRRFHLPDEVLTWIEILLWSIYCFPDVDVKLTMSV